MGIQGLLQGLSQHLVSEDATSSKNKVKHNIRQFANKSIAVDTSSWLFKASYSCAERVVEATESKRIDPTCERMICNYIIKRCDELLINASLKGIILVFDGKRCPLKAVTNREREKKRTQNIKEARRLKACGRDREAQEKYKACLKVTDWMADRVNRAVMQKWGNERSLMSPPKVRSVFSPYEADAQLAKLCIDGLADAIVTEDSDILVYSAACGVPFPIIYKLDRNSGSCDVISMDWLLSTSGVNKTAPHRSSFPPLRRYLSVVIDEEKDKGKHVKKTRKKAAGGGLLMTLRAMFTREHRQPGSGARLFIQSCILAGCDYAPSRLSGVGIVSAFKMIIENSHREPGSRFSHVLKNIPKEKILTDVDEDNVNLNIMQVEGQNRSRPHDLYEELLSKSEAVFYYHYVLHLKSRDIAPFMTLKDSAEKTDGSPTISLSDEKLHLPTGNKDRMQYYPCLKRFATNISFIGSDQGHIEVGNSHNLTATTPSNTSKLPFAYIKQPQIPCHVPQKESRLFSSKLSKGPKPMDKFLLTSQKRKSEQPTGATIQSNKHFTNSENKNRCFNATSSWKNRAKVNPLSKYALPLKKMKKELGLVQIQKEEILMRQPSPLPKDHSSRRHQRADSMSSVSSIDSLSITQCIADGQTKKKRQTWSKYFITKRDEDVDNSMNTTITTENSNMEYRGVGSRSGCGSSNLITPTCDIRQNARNIMPEIVKQGDANSSDQDQRKLSDLLSDEDSDSVVIIETSPAPGVSSVYQSPYSLDMLKKKDQIIELDSSPTIDIANSTSRAKNITLCNTWKPSISPQRKNRLFPNNTNISKTNANVQTRARFTSQFKQSNMMNKRINTSLHLTRKRTNTQSIKGFFLPLNTKNKSNQIH